MADTPSHKRRHTTSPPPPQSDLAADVSAAAMMPPPPKRGKRQSSEENLQPQQSNNQFLVPSTPRHTFSAQTRQGPSSRNPSSQNMASSGRGLMTTQQHGRIGAGETASTASRPLPQMASTATVTRPGAIMPLAVPQERPSAPADREMLAFMDNFVVDALALSPLSFPPASLNSEPEVYQPVTQATAPESSAYPEIEPWMQMAYTPPSTQTPPLPAPASATRQPIFPPRTNPAPPRPRLAPALLQRPIILSAQELANAGSVVPVEPSLVSEHYLWTQVEAAQMTMVGTLTALLMRQRAGELGLEVDDRQVQNVTSNLINIMSLWYMLRRERGWPL